MAGSKTARQTCGCSSGLGKIQRVIRHSFPKLVKMLRPLKVLEVPQLESLHEERRRFDALASVCISGSELHLEP